MVLHFYLKYTHSTVNQNLILQCFFSGTMFSLSNQRSTSLTMLTDDPVAMLVPLPNEETKALIGE